MNSQRSTINISVVLCTWNNSERLAITLDAIANCQFAGDWELVIVNNNCTDDTDSVVEERRQQLPIVYVKEPQQGLSRARNAGLSASSGELILFTDDDVKPVDTWLSQHWSAFQRYPEGFFFGGPIESEFEGNAPPRELLDIAPNSVKGLSWGTEERELTSDEWFVSANWSCPARFLRDVGGFDVSKGLNPDSKHVSVGEESDLMARLRQSGLRALYLPDASIKHHVPADKCTLAHIAERFEATGWELALPLIKETSVGGRSVRGVPLWLYRQTATKWLRWVWEKTRGQQGYYEYRAFRASVGKLKAFRHHNSGS